MTYTSSSSFSIMARRMSSKGGYGGHAEDPFGDIRGSTPLHLPGERGTLDRGKGGHIDEFYPKCYVAHDGATLRCRGLETGAEGALTPKGYVFELSPVGKARIKSFVKHLRVAAGCLLPPLGTTFHGSPADESFAIVGFSGMKGVPSSVQLLLESGMETQTFRQDLISKLIGQGSDLILWNGGLKVHVAPRQRRFQHQTEAAEPLQPGVGKSSLSQAPAPEAKTENTCQIAQGGEMVVWKTYMTPDGIPYYHCDALKITVWDAPDGAVVMPPEPDVGESSLSQAQAPEGKRENTCQIAQGPEMMVPGYHCDSLKTTVWDVPDCAVVTSPEENPDAVTWHEHTTADGLVYYHNPASEKSVWDKPEGVGVQDTAADDRASQVGVVVSMETRFAVGHRGTDFLITPLKVG